MPGREIPDETPARVATGLAVIERVKPKRVVIDSLSEMRLLAQSPLRYRRQVLALKQSFIRRECTVFLLDDLTSEVEDMQLQIIAHGVVCLEQMSPEYGAERRRLRILKLRGQRYRGSFHDFIINRGGLEVFPRLIAGEHVRGRKRGLLKSDNTALDTLLGGGLQYGTSTLLIGPAGSGKSTLAMQFARAAAGRGERAVSFAFDGRVETVLERMEGLGMDLSEYLDGGLITIIPVDTAELSHGQFAHHVRPAAPLREFHGVLSGMPTYRGPDQAISRPKDA